MTKPYYECHVTFLQLDTNQGAAERIVNGIGWTFSAIDNDIILGTGVKMYATRHFNTKHTEEEIKLELTKAATLLKEAGLDVVRRKIELVLFDDRSK